ncbi:DUF4163 domain-containing protein [Clostridium sp. OS1-26]|uniref:DUF4163 domain-containing protein n=1 Tax=Clostridium sp. OS1-26 TaxID=3070681 RepID=UPI0027E08D3E|nr:DUF4163 domain-containing protein [Clostridium sp. OS1-26]WML33950.1 DUF4163 domain-containing protein [Clostridium sp. OS1-26]
MLCPFKPYHAFCPFQEYSSCYVSSRTASNENALTVSTKNISSETSNIHESLQIPVFQGKINPRVLQHINDNIKSDILEFKSQMEAAANEYSKNLIKQGKPFTPFEISNTYLVTYNKNNILSTSIIYQQYIDGRSSHIRTTYNYDLTSGESMPLKSLFKQGVNYKDTLNKLIIQKINENKQLYPSGSAKQFKSIAEDQPYYLDNNNLVIFFRFNEIAPVASEIPVMRIPFSELSNILKPQLLRG